MSKTALSNGKISADHLSTAQISEHYSSSNNAEICARPKKSALKLERSF
jgi:hypothetical protein